MKDYKHADLIGENLSVVMVQELNRRLSLAKPSRSSDETDSLDVNLLYGSAKVFGTEPNNAYIHVELIAEGSEFTPFIITRPLIGASQTSCGSSNKDFLVRLRSESRDIINTYVKEMVSLLTFAGRESSLEECLLATLRNERVSCSFLKVYSFKRIEEGINYLSRSSEEYVDDSQCIVVTGRDMVPSGDLYESIDGSLIGGGESLLTFEEKASLISFCKKLIKLYFPCIMTCCELQIL